MAYRKGMLLDWLMAGNGTICLNYRPIVIQITFSGGENEN